MFRWLRVAVNLAGFVTLVLATITGIGTLTGDGLLRHVIVAPVFAVSAVAVTAFWAHRNRFPAEERKPYAAPVAWIVRLRQFFFWTAVLLALPTLSILAAMFPLFGTEGQRELLLVHRYCGALLSAAGFLFACFALAAWRAGSRD